MATGKNMFLWACRLLLVDLAQYHPGRIGDRIKPFYWRAFFMVKRSVVLCMCSKCKALALAVIRWRALGRKAGVTA